MQVVVDSFSFWLTILAYALAHKQSKATKKIDTRVASNMNRHSYTMRNTRPVSARRSTSWNMDESLTDRSTSSHSSLEGSARSMRMRSSSISVKPSPRLKRQQRANMSNESLRRSIRTLDASSNALLGNLPLNDVEELEEETREELPVIVVGGRRRSRGRSFRVPSDHNSNRRSSRSGSRTSSSRSRRSLELEPGAHLELQIPHLMAA